MSHSATHTAMQRAARLQIGCPFVHQGRAPKSASNKGSLDCLGLLMTVAAQCELKDKHGVPLTALDATDYSHYPNEDALREALEKALMEVPVQVLQPADMVLLRVDGRTQHLGLIGDYMGEGLSLIHAYAPARRVVEHRLDLDWYQRIEAAFRVV